MDLRTMLWANVGTSSAIALLLLAMWVQDRRLTLLAAWAGTLLVQAAAATLFALRGEIPAAWTLTGGNSLALLAHGMAWGR